MDRCFFTLMLSHGTMGFFFMFSHWAVPFSSSQVGAHQFLAERSLIIYLIFHTRSHRGPPSCIYLFIYLFIYQERSVHIRTYPPCVQLKSWKRIFFCIPEFNVTISRYIGVFVFIFPSSFIILSTDYKKRYSGATDERLISLATLLIRKHKDVDTDDKL